MVTVRKGAPPKQVCKEGKFAKVITAFCKLGFDVSSCTTAICIVDLAKFATFVYGRWGVVLRGNLFVEPGSIIENWITDLRHSCPTAAMLLTQLIIKKSRLIKCFASISQAGA
jgi:hypothetical protein